MSTTIPRAQVPFLDTALALTRTLSYFKRLRARHGDMVATRILGRSIVVYGAQRAQRILSDAEAFPSRDGYAFLEPFVEHSLPQMDGEAHTIHRWMVAPAFHGDHLSCVNRAYDREIGRWADRGTAVFYHEAHKIAFRVASSLILGVEDDLADLHSLLRQLFAGALTILRLNLPFLIYGKSLAAKPLLEQRLRTIIGARREQPATDVLTALLQAKDEHGQPLSDEQICAHLELFLFAGYDTTAAALAWCVLELLSNPDAYARVAGEAGVGSITGKVPVTAEELRAMPFLDAVVKETLRLHPPNAFLVRGANGGARVGGVTIPAGWQVVLPSSYTLRSPEYFADPDEFDPTRFLPPREEDKKEPAVWLVFGGGKHRCLGAGIAPIEMKVALVRLLREFRLQLVPGQDVSTVYLPTTRPKDGALISFQRRH